MRLLAKSTCRTLERRILHTLAAMALSGMNLLAQGSPRVDHPEQHASGTIRIWGYRNGKSLLAAWEQSFRSRHPNVRFETQLYGNASAIGGLYTGAADIAFMTRDIALTEIDGYQQALGHKPIQVSVLTGSVGIADHDPAVVIFVHKDNPLTHLTLAQLDATFGADHRRGSKNMRQWGQLGLSGEWAGRPIHLYGYDVASDVSQFFEHAVMAGSEKWNCSLQEFSDRRLPEGHLVDAGQQILDALAKDRDGIAISSVSYRNPLTKALALAFEQGGPYFTATRQAVQERQYPLTRPVSIFFDRAPDQPIDENLREFITYILSDEGQATARKVGDYLPLTPELARQELKKIE
jgi:phosphate transport system substrate-binding protein